MRAWFGATGQLVPALAERQAAHLFLTPRRRQRPAAPTIDGQTGHAFALQLHGHRLTAWSWGEGPLALLVHGWEGSAAHMAPAAGRLVEAGYRAVAFDMPAHGHASGRRTSLVEWLAVLRALPTALGRAAVVVGHSFGATALVHALADTFPADRAILLAPPLGPRHFVARARRFIGLPAHREEGMIRRLGEIVGRDIAEFDAGRAAARIAVPALILHDPADPDVPWSHAETIARHWHGSRLIAREGVGHYRILNDPGTLDLIGIRE
jgi:pimeloyl-ACP methyl ester carboxylesterase